MTNSKKILYQFWTIDFDTGKRKDGSPWMTLDEARVFFENPANSCYVLETHKYVKNED